MYVAKTDGLNALIQLCQTKTGNANEEALAGANKGREIQKDMKGLRDQLRAFEDKVRVGTGEDAARVTAQEQDDIATMLRTSGLDWGTPFELRGEGGSRDAVLGAEGIGRANADVVERIRGQFEDAIKDLESMDKLSNFEIQDLMSTMNQNTTLSTNQLKELSSMRMGVIRNVGG